MRATEASPPDASTTPAETPEGSARGRFVRFVRWTLVVNLAVIVWGAFVRASGSGAGCGSHWPLCNGEMIPRAPSAQTLIELSHRLTSGVALVLVVLLVAMAWRGFAPGSPVRRYAALTLFLMLTEAGVGAGLVLFELVADNESMARALFMAVHLANTFFLLAAMTLTLHTAQGHRAPDWRGLWHRRGWLVGLALLGTVAVGTSGAVAALGDTLFPASTLNEAWAADLSPTSHVLIQLRILHPVIAIAVSCLLLLLAAGARSGEIENARRWARWLSLAVFGQVGLGIANVTLLAPIPLQLLHLLLADLLWIALIRLAAARLTPATAAGASAVALGGQTRTSEA